MREKSWALLDQLAVSGGNFATIALCANLLSVEEQGRWMYSYIYYLLLLILNISLVFQAAQVLMPRSSEPESYRTKLFSLQLIIASFGTLIILLVPLVLAEQVGDSRTNIELLALAAFLFTQQLADYTRRMEHVVGSARRAALGSLTVYGVRIFALAMIALQNSAEVLWICTITALPPIFIHLKNNFGMYAKHISQRGMDVGQHLSISRSLLATATLSWTWSFFPVFMLGAIEGAASVAVLASIRSLTNVANVAMEYIEVSLIAPMASRVNREGHEILWPVMSKLVLGGVPIFGIGALVILFFGERALGLILGSNYEDYQNILMIVWAAYAIYFVGRIQAIAYRIGLNTRVELFGAIFSAGAAVASSYPLIVRLGVEGAAYSYLAIALSGLLAQVGFSYQQKKSVE